MQAMYRVSRLVEFRETDAAGILHFASFFGMMEEAEHSLLRSLGLSVVLRRDEQTISWPRVAASCDYHAAAKFEDQLDIDVAIERLGSKSVTYVFQFTRDDKPIATGKMTSVCCLIRQHEPPQSIEIPDFFLVKLRPYVTA